MEFSVDLEQSTRNNIDANYNFGQKYFIKVFK